MMPRGKLCFRRPMKIVPISSLNEVAFPTLLVPKYPGIRVLKISGVWMDEDRKPICGHKYICEHNLPDLPDGIDAVYQNGGLYVYDYVTPTTCGYGYRERLKIAGKELQDYRFAWRIVGGFYVKSEQSLYKEWDFVDKTQCYFRSPTGRYLQGQSAKATDQLWLEYTFPYTRDGIIKDVFAKNKKERKWSKYEATDDLGGLIVEDDKTKHQFPITSGFGLDKHILWRNRTSLIGMPIRYSCTAMPTESNAPLNPKYVHVDLKMIDVINKEQL
jgi:hypothetical protein